MAYRIGIFISCILLASSAYAMDIYRWVDENGRTSISDKVPERYKNVASKVDTSASELTESQQQEALARAAREKQRAEEAASAEQSKPVSSTSSAGQLTPSSDTQNADCEELMRAYRESQECFAPFIIRGPEGKRRRSAAVREEAFRYCTELPDPSQQCGSPPQYLEP